MRSVAIFLIMVSCGPWTRAQQVERAPKRPSASAASPTSQAQLVEVPESSQAPPQTLSGEAGYLEPAQVKALLHKVWLAEYRINDLLTQVRPERWKLSDTARKSFNQMLETLRAQLVALEGWRSQFEKRPDSIYLGYETYAAINAVLPRLDGVARSMTQRENPSLGVQYSQAGNQLFDLLQALEPYLGFLMRNQDTLFYALQTNLANCQNELGYAMRGRAGPAKPMKSFAPVRPERRRTDRTARTTGGASGAKSKQMPATKATQKK